MSGDSSDDVDGGEYFTKEGRLPSQGFVPFVDCDPGPTAIQDSANALATHLRAEVERSGLVAPPAVVAFLERYAT